MTSINQFFHSVTQFKDKYFFLSNFYPYEQDVCIDPYFKFQYDGVEFKTTEHAFQYKKTKNKIQQETILFAPTPGMAKRLGKKVQLVEDWDYIKDEIMFSITLQKFEQNPHLADLLLDTGNSLIYEGNTWKDTYWGIDSVTLEGKNVLGRIIMDVRDILTLRGY